MEDVLLPTDSLHFQDVIYPQALNKWVILVVARVFGQKLLIGYMEGYMEGKRHKDLTKEVK